MKRRKLVAIAAGGLALVTALLVVAALVVLARIDTPEFRKQLLTRVEAALGTKVRVAKMDLSLFSGVQLEKVGIANPRPFSGDILTADAFTFRYRLWPLVLGRLDVDRLSLERPVLSLAMDARGGYNFERLGRAAGPPAAAARSTSVPLELRLSKLSIEGGRVGVSVARAAAQHRGHGRHELASRAGRRRRREGPCLRGPSGARFGRRGDRRSRAAGDRNGRRDDRSTARPAGRRRPHG